MSGSVLVTGAAGFVGAHAVLALLESGRDVVAVDNLSSGGAAGRAMVPSEALFLRGDFADTAALARVFSGREISAVVHMAASVSVPESMARPLVYWRNNVAKTLALAQFCVSRGVRRFVFSSSAAVYGEGAEAPLREDFRLSPMNPYGATKMTGERIFSDLARATGKEGGGGGIGVVSLRYFNVAGADALGRAGDPKRGGGGLFKAAMECATGAREALAICGTDFPTADGSAVRDYIHVSDVAAANVLALDYLERRMGGGGGTVGSGETVGSDGPDGTVGSGGTNGVGGTGGTGGICEVFNCGLGRGFSVREVAESALRISGGSFRIEEAGRRLGDPASLTADAEKIGRELGFVPKFPELDDMIKTALAWERKMQTERGEG